VKSILENDWDFSITKHTLCEQPEKKRISENGRYQFVKNKGDFVGYFPAEHSLILEGLDTAIRSGDPTRLAHTSNQLRKWVKPINPSAL